MSKLADYDLLDQVGKGSFGVVYRARRKVDEQIYCLKSINLDGASQAEVNNAVRECQLLAKINSPFVIRYYDSFVDTDTVTLWIVMEYASKGTLRELILKSDIDEETAWYYITQILIGISTLHVNHIIHRDIKSLNIFVNEEPNGRLALKIGDLGVAKELNSTMQLAQTIVGSPYYLSPEICQNFGYNSKSDIFALGVTFFEMLNHGKHPFEGKNQGALIYNIIKGKYSKCLDSDKYSSFLRHFVYWCLCKDIASRPTAFVLLAMKCVQDVIYQYKFPLPAELRTHVQKEKDYIRSQQSARIQSGKATAIQSAKSEDVTKSYSRQGNVLNEDSAAAEHQNAQPHENDGRRCQAQLASLRPRECQVQIGRKLDQQATQENGFLIIEEDVISVTPSQPQPSEVKCYEDDFDEDDENAENQQNQSQIDELVHKQTSQKQELDKLKKQLLKYHIKPSLELEIIKWMMYNKNASQQEAQKYVLRKLPIEKEKAVSILEQIASLEENYEDDALKLQSMLEEVK